MVPPMNRVCFLIDGFNLYHSLCSASKPEGSPCLKWLDLVGMCNTLTTSTFPPPTIITGIHYFSALAHHRESENPGTVERHQAYIAALEATGVLVRLGNFKEKPGGCLTCGARFMRHEEKETDVAMAAKLLELFATDACDAAVFITGDTDIIPAIQTARQLWPEKVVRVGFPYRRRNKHLASAVTSSFKIGLEHYQQHQLPDLVEGPLGPIAKPATW